MDISRSERSVDLNWEHVFTASPNIPVFFDVTVGSTQGSADIVDNKAVSSHFLSFSTPESTFDIDAIKELFISVKCVYSTGLSTTYKTSYKLF